MAHVPTVYVIASDQHRNGKTLLARVLADYLLLDGLDPFLIDTDVPEAPLRAFFPGRTQIADFANIQGRMKVFDTILGSTGRDYVIDLPQRHTIPFFNAVKDLNFFEEAKNQGFRIFVLFIVDKSQHSLRAARETAEIKNIDLFVPICNEFIGSDWPLDEGAFTIPALPFDLMELVLNKRFSFRSFILGDAQNLSEEHAAVLRRFIYELLQNLSNLDPITSLDKLKS